MGVSNADRIAIYRRVLFNGLDEYLSDGIIEALVGYLEYNNNLIVTGGTTATLNNRIFDSTSQRDAFFQGNDDDGNPRYESLTTGYTIGVNVNGTTQWQQWDGPDNPTTYDADNWEVTNFFAATLISNSNSVRVGDSRISSGGRMINAMSDSTGRLGAFIIQLFDDTSYSPATVYDPDPVSTVVDTQITADTESSNANITYNVRVVASADNQIHHFRIKPASGTISSGDELFYELRLAPNGAPIYSTPVESSEFTEISTGVYEFDVVNPSQIDGGSNIYVRFSGLSLLGGTFDGSDGVRFGDSSNGNFFPWVQTVAIPINRLPIATEAYVQDNLGITNLDGGVADTIYLTSQIIDGGVA